MSDSEEEVLLLAAAAVVAYNGRQYWVHPTLENRDEDSEFFRIIRRLKRYPDRFYNYFHMPLTAYEELLEILTPMIEPKETNFRKSISAEQRLAVTLRFLATGDSFRTIAFSFVMGDSTVGKIVWDTCCAIWQSLQPVYMPTPDERIWRSNEKGFNKDWQYPHCCGSIDGKHIRIEAPPNSGTMYWNYKKYFSLVLLAVVSYDYTFTTIDVGAYGSNSDGGILAASNLGKGLQAGSIGIPKPAPIEGAERFGEMGYSLLGDEAFPLQPYLMRPFPGRQKPEDEEIFNYRLSRGRRVVENAFGILANKFRLYHRLLFIDPGKAVDVVKATCVLHNFLRRKKVHGYYEEAPEGGLKQAEAIEKITGKQMAGNRSANDSIKQRNDWKTFFVSPEGAVPWQWDMVRRGLVDDRG